MPPPLPRYSGRAYSSLISPSRFSLPRFHYRVGLHIVLFEVCSAFTHIAACTLAQSPYFVTAIRGLQTFRHLHACPGCFRLERSRVGLAPTGKAPPCHGARGKQTSGYSANITRILPVFCTKGTVLLEVNLDKLTKIS